MIKKIDNQFKNMQQYTILLFTIKEIKYKNWFNAMRTILYVLLDVCWMQLNSEELRVGTKHMLHVYSNSLYTRRDTWWNHN